MTTLYHFLIGQWPLFGGGGVLSVFTVKTLGESNFVTATAVLTAPIILAPIFLNQILRDLVSLVGPTRLTRTRLVASLLNSFSFWFILAFARSNDLMEASLPLGH